MAQIGHRLVGLLQLNYLWPGHEYGVPFVSLIRVVPGYRRRGVGRALLAFLEEDLRRRRYKILMSSCTRDELEPRQWHRHMGFTECGDLAGTPFEDGRGEVFLYKRLDRRGPGGDPPNRRPTLGGRAGGPLRTDQTENSTEETKR